MTNTEFKKRGITAKKYMGDDEYSWAIFVNNRPIMTGLTRSEVPYYKRQVLNHIIDKSSWAVEEE